MILVIPSVFLCNGKAIHTIQGEPGTESFYENLSEHPELLCGLFRREDAKTIMIIDKDSFDNSTDYDNRETIFKIIKNLDIPIQLLYNFKNIEEIEYFFQKRVQRVVIGSFAYHNPEEIKHLIGKYTSSRIIFYLHTDTSSLKDMKDVDIANPYHYAEFIINVGGQRFMYYDEEWERQGKPDFVFLKDFAQTTRLKITIGSGVSTAKTLRELQSLQKFGIDSAIISEAFYKNRFPCQKIWRKIEAQLEVK